MRMAISISYVNGMEASVESGPPTFNTLTTIVEPSPSNVQHNTIETVGKYWQNLRVAPLTTSRSRLDVDLGSLARSLDLGPAQLPKRITVALPALRWVGSNNCLPLYCLHVLRNDRDRGATEKIRLEGCGGNGDGERVARARRNCAPKHTLNSTTTSITTTTTTKITCPL